MRIVFLRGGCFSPDFDDCIPQFQSIYKPWHALDGAWETQVVDPLKIESGDINLLKAGSGGFYTSSLDIRLRNMGIDQIVYSGVVVNTSVLATLAAGFDLGYQGWLVSDATATFSERLQVNTEEIIEGNMATVISTEETIKMIAGKKRLAYQRKLHALHAAGF